MSYVIKIDNDYIAKGAQLYSTRGKLCTINRKAC